MNAMKACWGGGVTAPLILKIKGSRGFHLTPKKLYSSRSLNRLLRGLQGRSWHFASTEKLSLSCIKQQFLEFHVHGTVQLRKTTQATHDSTATS